MGKLILYSLAAHLIVVSLIFTVPLVSKTKVERGEFYRVSFVELPASAPRKKVRAPEPKKPTLPKRGPEKKEVSTKPRQEAKKKESPPVPGPAEMMPAPGKPEKVPRAITSPSKAGQAGYRKEAMLGEEEQPRAEAGERLDEPTTRAAESTASFGPKGVGAGGASFKLAPTEDVDFPYPYYLAVMQRKIGERWHPVYGEFVKRSDRRVVIYFRVLRDGTIKDIKLEQSSGDLFLDRSAMKAVVDAGPMPPLPHEFEGEELQVHFGFEYFYAGDRGVN